MIFRAALLQIDSQDDKDTNLAKISRMIDEAAEKHADFIAMPEFVNYIGGRRGFIENSEDIPDGETSELFSRKAREHHIWILGGSIAERIPDDDTHVYNTSAVFNPKGEVAAMYRKIHLADHATLTESNLISAGSSIATFTAPFAKMGVAICYDLRFPELFRVIAIRGAKVIVVPSEFNINTGRDHWETLLRARAIENACWIVAPDQIGTKRNMTSTGRSMVVDAWGNVIAQASDRECVLMAEIDTDYVDTVRARMPSLNHRRPDIYGHVC